MKKFDGILICSDIDATFKIADSNITANKKAVEYFIENGGKFTFATGRMADFLIDNGLFSIINAPACLGNGSLIYDYEKRQAIFSKRVDFTAADFLKASKDMLTKNTGIHIHDLNPAKSVYTTYENIDKLTKETLNSNPLKIICIFENTQEADSYKETIFSHSLFKNTYIAKSWSVGLEFINSSATKGHALDYLKAYYGNIHTTVGIGDYENDIPLLQHADIAVAVENALNEVKENADFCVKKCEENAIENLIEILDGKF